MCGILQVEVSPVILYLVSYRKVSQFILSLPSSHPLNPHMFFIPFKCQVQNIKSEINLGGVMWEAYALLASVESCCDRDLNKKKAKLISDSFFFEVSVIYKLTLVLFSQMCYSRWEWLHPVCSSVCEVLSVWQRCWWFLVLVGLHGSCLSLRWLTWSLLWDTRQVMALFCIYGWNTLCLAYISFSELG